LLNLLTCRLNGGTHFYLPFPSAMILPDLKFTTASPERKQWLLDFVRFRRHDVV